MRTYADPTGGAGSSSPPLEEGGDVETGIDELIGDGNLVAERWWIRSSAVGDAGPNGHGVTIHRIVNGKLQENWAVFHPEN